MPPSPRAVIFDLDGVLTDTAQLHCRSWELLAEEEGRSFGQADYERMRGLAREASLAVFLGSDAGDYDSTEKASLARRKNDHYLEMVAKLTPADAFPGVVELLDGLQAAGARLAVASASRNANPVLERLGLLPRFDAVVDSNTAPRSKPDPIVFEMAADAIEMTPNRCVVIEDAAAGVQAAIAAKMRVVGIGPRDRVGAADLVVSEIAELDADAVLGLLEQRS